MNLYDWILVAGLVLGAVSVGVIVYFTLKRASHGKDNER